MHPVALNLGGLTIHWYGVMVVAGFLAGLWTASRRGLREGIAAEAISDLGLWLMLGAIGGARVWHVVAYWQSDYADKPWWEPLAVQHGGLVFHGGLVGATLATMVFARHRRLPLWKLADALAPSIALGHVFGRLGCLFNGCCYGTPASCAWAVHYPAGHATVGTAVHPVQIYESLLNLALYLGLAWWFRRKRFDGQIFSLYLIAYGVLRFAVEFFRGDYAVTYLGGWLCPGQVVSIPIALIGVGLYVKQLRAGRPAPPTPP